MDLNSLKNIDLTQASPKVDKGLFLIFYNKNKIFLLPLIVILISVFMLFSVIIPQIKQYFAQREQLDVETKKLQVLKNSFNYLSSLDTIQVESDLKLLTKVLPIDKDLLGIMTAVSAASSKAGMGINSYRFTPGNLSKVNNEVVTTFPNIVMELKTDGNGRVLSKFLKELYITVPILDVLSIKHENNSALVKLAFYFKPFPPENISDDKVVNKLSEKDKELLKSFYTWNNLQVANGLLVSEGNKPSSSVIEVNYISSGSAQFITPQASSGAFYPF